MKKYGLRNSAVPTAVCGCLCLTGTAYAQVTPAQLDQLKNIIGNRAEVAIVLGASDSAGGGTYTVDERNGNDEQEFSLFKFGGGGLIGEPRPLGDSGVRWSPMVMGMFGYISGDEADIAAGPLAGNSFEESAIGIQLGGGVAFHLTDRFTVTPYAGIIYGHYEMDFTANNAVGQAIKSTAEDSVDTIGGTPGIGLEYRLPVGSTTITFGGRYTYFGTTDIGSSDIEGGGDSHILEQRVDVDVPLDAELFGCKLHTGGYVSLTEPFGDIEDTMSSSYWATIHPRLLLNTEGKLWKVERMGLGFSYIKGEHFDGWDVGIDISFKF